MQSVKSPGVATPGLETASKLPNHFGCGLSTFGGEMSLDPVLSLSTIGGHSLPDDNVGGDFADSNEFMANLSQVPDIAGRFGDFGGRYVPETLTAALDELAVRTIKRSGTKPFRTN